MNSAALFVALALAAPAETPFVELSTLYGNRLLFDAQGIPLIPVRVMDQQTRVQLSSPAPITVRTGAGQTFTHPAHAPLVVERAAGKAAARQQVFILETLEGDTRKDRAKRRDFFKAQGIAAEILNVGGVYGVGGKVFDNRAALIVAKTRPTPAQEKALSLRPVPIERLEQPPAVTMLVRHAAGAESVRDVVQLEAAAGAAITVRRVEHSIGYPQHGFEDRTFRGALSLAADRTGQLAVVNLVPEDVLVAGVLPSELFATAPMAALKAQAITARGEVFAKVGKRHLADPYLVCSAQHCQVYKGQSAEHPRSNEAAQQTRGQLLFKDGQLVDSVYSACCGGHTEPSHIVWDQPPKSALTGRADAPFADPAQRIDHQSPGNIGLFMDQAAHGPLPVQPVPIDLRTDPAVEQLLALPREATYCGASTFNQKGDAYRWTRRLTRQDLARAFARHGLGPLLSLSIPERGPGGRLRMLVATDVTGKSVTIRRELPVRRLFSPALRSGLFVIDTEKANDGSILAVTLRGAGFGHGSGMCQQGAIGMAEAGHDEREILRHYYAGAEVQQVFGP